MKTVIFVHLQYLSMLAFSISLFLVSCDSNYEYENNNDEYTLSKSLFTRSEASSEDYYRNTCGYWSLLQKVDNEKELYSFLKSKGWKGEGMNTELVYEAGSKFLGFTTHLQGNSAQTYLSGLGHGDAMPNTLFVYTGTGEEPHIAIATGVTPLVVSTINRYGADEVRIIDAYGIMY